MKRWSSNKKYSYRNNKNWNSGLYKNIKTLNISY
jgi:hypothetical protein